MSDTAQATPATPVDTSQNIDPEKHYDVRLNKSIMVGRHTLRGVNIQLRGDVLLAQLQSDPDAIAIWKVAING